MRPSRALVTDCRNGSRGSTGNGRAACSTASSSASVNLTGGILAANYASAIKLQSLPPAPSTTRVGPAPDRRPSPGGAVEERLFSVRAMGGE